MRDDLARVEQEISAQNAEAIPAVAEVGSYVIQGGGKRLRPALLLLSAGMCGYRGTSTIRLGAVMEMIHTATLIHDDVIDDTNLRRGRPSANSRWGNHRSVLAGDWLYMQSFQLAMRERNFRILDVLIELTQNMVEGELLQLDLIGKLDVNDRQAVELSYRKTACLFSGCAQLGAVLAAQDPETEQALADYGRFAGLAFQLVDDLLDFTSDPEKIGKPVLNDLKEGKVTLPLIYALESARPEERKLVAAVLADLVAAQDRCAGRAITGFPRGTGEQVMNGVPGLAQVQLRIGHFRIVVIQVPVEQGADLRRSIQHRSQLVAR